MKKKGSSEANADPSDLPCTVTGPVAQILASLSNRLGKQYSAMETSKKKLKEVKHYFDLRTKEDEDEAIRRNVSDLPYIFDSILFVDFNLFSFISNF